MLRCILLFVVFVLSISVNAQKAYKKQGDIYFEVGKYREALDAYNKHKKIGKDPETLIKRGIST